MSDEFILYYNKLNILVFIENDEVLDNLYELTYRVISIDDIKKHIKTMPNDKLTKYLKKVSNYDTFLENLKIRLSKINNKIPLYDTYSDNLYLISREMVYTRVIRNHYRFPDEKLVNKLIDRYDVMKKKKNMSILEERTKRKYKYMIQFLNYFDLKILEQTYIDVLYNYSNEIGKNITLCKRPSFLQHFYHISPYYTRSELINMGLNMGLIKVDDTYYDKDKVNSLCTKVSKNDISADILLEHQVYMITSKKIGIIQYYSLQGSYFMNQYLRDLTEYRSKNEELEKHIISMNDVIDKSPAFDKEYIVYRFIEDDSFLTNIDIGDKFIDKGFISTTRDPFYNSEQFKFGFILIKIKLPAKLKGIALCIETVSHFPQEEEIILSPYSVLRLDKKDSNCVYYHTDDNFATKVKTRYEFTYLHKKKLQLTRTIPSKNTKLIHFLKIDKHSSLTLDEKISHFVKHYSSDMYTIKSTISGKEYDIQLEWYDSTGVYSDFYAIQSNNGFCMYNITNDKLNFIIEIGEDENNIYSMYVNYYFKFTKSNIQTTISDEGLLTFVSSVAYYFGIRIVVINSEYSSCDSIIKNNEVNHKYYGGNYCIEFYNYLKHKKQRYRDIDSAILKSKFKYYDLDRLAVTNPLEILDKKDRDELYQIYKKTYVPFTEKKDHNLLNFYIWVVDNHCYIINELTLKMSRLYQQNNPFEMDYYLLDSYGYLYNKNCISTYYNTDVLLKNKVGDVYVHKNKYRNSINYKHRAPTKRKIK